MRLLLTQLGFFRDPETTELADRLVIAYKDFKACCSHNKVYSSQPLFTVANAAFINYMDGLGVLKKPGMRWLIFFWHIEASPGKIVIPINFKYEVCCYQI